MTNFKPLILSSIFAASILGACASTPDPAEVCTAEWIKPRTERAVGRIESRTKSAIKPLKKAAESYAKGKKPNFVQMLSLNSSFKRLEKELKSGRGITDLKTLATTCNDPVIVTDALLGFLQDQNLPPWMIGFIQDMPLFQDLINFKPNPANQS